MTAFAFNLVRLNNTLLSGVRQPDFQRREKYAPLETDGTLYQTSRPVIRAAPMAGFTTVAFRALVQSLTATSGIPYTLLDGTNGLELIGAKINPTSPGYDSTVSVHARRQHLNGLLMLKGISWRPGDVAEASVEAFFTSAAGGTDPTVGTSITLPAIPTGTEQLVLSGITMPGGTISATRVTGFDLSINHQVENNDDAICFNTGLPFPILLKQPGVGGTAEIGLSLEVLDLTGTLANGAVSAVFTRLAHNGVGLTTGTVTIALANCQIREAGIGSKPGARKLDIFPTFDGTTAAFTATAA
jgi:hypothetical protein